MALKRSIGITGLTFIGIGGVLGSGWLFAPMLAVHHAGPAAIIAWLIGGFAILLIALPFAEVTGCLPEAGAIARVPHYSHGSATSMLIGWSAWVGYATQAPIETLAMIRYVAPLFPELDLAVGKMTTDDLSLRGYLVVAGILLLMTVINVLGVTWLNKANAIMTTVKILVPAIVVMTFVGIDFKASNFTEFGGFAPMGIAGIFSAVSVGGVVFALLGFRHIVDLAGEAKRPQVTIPAALFLTVGLCFLIYVLVQIAFVGAMPADRLTDGWAKVEFDHHLGPLAGIATIIGISWLIALLYGAAIIGPLGAGLVSTGSNARLGLALSLNGFFPSIFEWISGRGVPVYALILTFLAGLVLLLFPFQELVALNSSAIVLSLCIGPLAVVALRRSLPDQPRPIRLPMVWLIGLAAFIVATFIIYWSGWSTIWRLDAALILGLLLYRVKLLFQPVDDPLNWRAARWLLIYLVCVTGISYLGHFGGGIGILPIGFDMAAIAVIGLVCFQLGLRDALPPERTQELVEASMEGP